MALFLFKRLITLLATLAATSVVVFAVLELLPGNAAEVILGDTATPEAVAALQAKLGLDRPAGGLIALHQHNEREASAAVLARLAHELHDRFAIDHATIQVGDNGPGIAPDIAAHVFDLLRTSKDNGMGVGLWLSKTILESHGGNITFVSVPDTSTVFTIKLPANQSDMVY